MDIDPAGATPWYRRPGPTLVVGLLLLAVCAGCFVLWIGRDGAIARPAGLVTGGAGIYLVYGALYGLRERAAR